MAHLDDIIAANQRLVSQSPPAPRMTWTAKRELCVITCVDPRLMRFFPTTLGLERGDAVIIRVPGANLLVGHGDGLRSVAAAVYINKASEFLVLGHTDCGTTHVDVGAVTSEMQRRGVVPDAMPGGPREFLAAAPDVHPVVKASAAAIRAAPFLPRDLLVHAAILDIETGALEIVERGENFQDAQQAGPATGTVGYTPGRATGLGTGLGDGMSLLASSSISAIFDGASALASNADPFAGLAGQLPPGWSDAGAALAPAAVAASAPGSVDFSSTFTAPAPLAAAPAQAMAAPIQLVQPVSVAQPTVVSFDSPKPKPRAEPRAAARPQKPRAAPARPAPRPVSPELEQNLSKVRDFYRLNFSLEQRRAVARALASAARNERSSGELAKVVIKPILDLGQKRYKVIDEVIAIKEQATRMPPDDALELLSRLFD